MNILNIIILTLRNDLYLRGTRTDTHGVTLDLSLTPLKRNSTSTPVPGSAIQTNTPQRDYKPNKSCTSSGSRNPSSGKEEGDEKSRGGLALLSISWMGGGYVMQMSSLDIPSEWWPQDGDVATSRTQYYTQSNTSWKTVKHSNHTHTWYTFIKWSMGKHGSILAVIVFLRTSRLLDQTA